MSKRRPILIVAGVAALACGLTLSARQAPPATAPFTAAQAQAGQAVYLSRCAGCHLADLGGRNEAPALAGPNFMSAWRTRTARDLHDYLRGTMPPGGAGTLSADEYLTVTAYILQANGATAGT